MATADLYDWEKCTTLLADQSLWWEPGTASGYHTVNYGFLVGEMVRRITGLKLGEFFRSEIAQPLEADFHIGLDPSEFYRVANLVPPPPFDLSSLDSGSVSFKSLCNPPLDPLAPRTDPWRVADIGAANGHGNARSVARIQSLVANGGAVDGIRLLSTQTVDRIFQTQSQGTDLVLGIPLKMGMGYALPVPDLMPHILTGRVCYWGGWGGSSVVVDVDRRMTITYMMNKMAADIAGGGIAAALVACAYACHKST
jgi:CubicO group peptidase (beta-lactamase class C family)